mgnify:CR=1 FL=1
MRTRSSSSFASPPLASLSSPIAGFVFAVSIVATILGVLLVYSIFSNTLRVHQRHCCGNDGPVFDACGGYALHRNEQKTLRLFCLELGCVMYSHTLLVLSWVAVVIGTLQTCFGTVFGTIAYACGVMCDLGDTAYAVIAESASRLPILEELFRDSTGVDLTNTTAVQHTLCADPPTVRQAGIYLIAGPPMITLALVMLLVGYSAIYKVHQMQGEQKAREMQSQASDMSDKVPIDLLRGV